MMQLKGLILLFSFCLTTQLATSQRGVRIGYIDTEYILENVSEYKQASAELDKKALKWKTAIEAQLKDIEQKRIVVENERVLLTKELYDERMDDIAFDERKVLEYQQQRFGPTGDLILQKRQLMQPVQDQIFAAIQEIATLKKYDFVFDKSADVVMLYSAERYDISDQVIKILTRASKREQAKTKKERKQLEEEAVVPEVNKELDKSREARAKQLEERKAKREKQLEERRKKQQEIRDQRKKEIEARKAAAKAKRENRTKATKTKDTINTQSNNRENKQKETVAPKKLPGEDAKKSSNIKNETIKSKQQKDREARQKALDERKKKALEKRKKAIEARKEQARKRDSIINARKNNK